MTAKQQDPQKILLDGVAAHRAGRLDQAENRYRHVLELQKDHPDALHLLGVIALARRDHGQALGLIGRAVALRPQEATFHNNLANAQLAGGDARAAADHAQKAIALRPDYSDAHNSLAAALIADGQPQAGAKAARRALELRPAYPQALGNLGDALGAMDELAAAAEAYGRALAMVPKDVTLLLRLARTRLRLHDIEAAAKAADHAVQLAPNRADAQFLLGNVAKLQGDLARAIAAYDRALSIDGRFYEALLNRGHAHKQAGDFAQAAQDYRRAAEIDTARAQPLFCLAQLYEESNDLDQAGTIVQEALAREPDDGESNCLAGVLKRRDGDLTAARAFFEKASRQATTPETRMNVQFELGKILDRQGDRAAAFSHFETANGLQAELETAAMAGKADYLNRVAALSDFMATNALPLPTWRPGAGSSPSRPAPAFLIGFPRSGTTLLDQILDAHPGIRVVEEQPLIETLWRRVAAHPEGYPGALPRLTAADLATLRDLYFTALDTHWEQTGGDLKKSPDGDLVVDKFPLNALHLSLIHQVFPEARVILALRHPCDVVLSCFMQQFALNDAMANFTTLADGARLYAAVMGLLQDYRARLDLPVHEIRYESLVADFTPTVADLLTFLDVPWDDSVAGFTQHARSRGRIATPSYSQVSEPLYQRAKFRWHGYRDRLAPVMDDLIPLIAQFGYER